MSESETSLRPSSETSVIDEIEIHDRVFEAYYGKMGEGFMRETQRRIHWICSHVKGECALDVGCSQGIVPILLAREGCRVTGVDLDEKAVKQAWQFSANEPELVKSRLDFVHSDFFDFEASGAVYQTVILSEVLEHLVRPELFVKKAASLLEESDGTLVVTTPFGINDFIDHKTTYYLSALMKTLHAEFCELEYEILGRWIGIVAKRPRKQPSTELPNVCFADLQRLEEGFYQLERPLRELVVSLQKSKSELRGRVNELNEKAREARINLSKAEARINDLESKSKAFAQLEVDLKGAEERALAFEEKVLALSCELSDSQLACEHLEANLEKSEESTLVLNSELSNSRQECVRLKNRLKESEGRADTLTDELSNSRQSYTLMRNQKISAEKKIKALQRSTTYQLGYHIKQAGSLAGLMRLPLAIFRVYRAFRTKRKASTSQSRNKKNLPPVSGTTQSHAVSESNVRQIALGSYSSKFEELSSSPIWYRVSVNPAENILISSAISGQSDGGSQGNKARSALMLLKFYGISGQQIDVECGKLAWSRQFHAQFKYLTSTAGAKQQIHAFTTPTNVYGIEIGFCRFGALKSDRICLNYLSVSSAPATTEGEGERFSLDPRATAIFTSGWPSNKESDKPVVLGVMDEFTEGCFKNDLNLVQPRPDNWLALAEKYKPSMFFIESAWKGNHGSWQYRVGDYANKPGQEISQMADYARQKGIPMVFWNKEDPVHHEKFMCSAKVADYIFTTDKNMCGSYEEKTGNTAVYALPFAAQPVLHKPAALHGRIPRACFAGSWYGNRHAERGEAMAWLLRAAKRHGVDIYDRNYETGNFPFPAELQENIKGSLSYESLCKEYNRYRLFLNVNSVTDSPTMFSRRVFELMACGTPVVSTYARGIEELFDNEVIWLVNNEAEAEEAIYTLLNDDAEWRRRSLLGIREVFTNHTYAHRLNEVFQLVGAGARLDVSPNILFVGRVNKESELDAFINFVQVQKYRNFTLMVEFDGSVKAKQDAILDKIEIVSSGYLRSSSFKERALQFHAVGWLSAIARYGKYYSMDLVNAMRYEPEANGWAKATANNEFLFDVPAELHCAVWTPRVFSEKWCASNAGDQVSYPSLFTLDSNEFTPQSMPMTCT
ncbi:glycosyltransferase family protein [Microbulbifer magnicolonia]|uniref:glycosyltransferase family protein n=1 Tax=Microbulbifer magnicolonia TaxID=3109744 RepID=UPI002B4108F5|nr:glycosyltransferase [Microbulbifer sp. GG15]